MTIPSMDYLSTKTLRAQLARLGRAYLADRLHALRRLSTARGLRYIDDHHTPHTIELALIPWLLTPAQMRFFTGVGRTLIAALLRVPALYRQDPAVRRILALDPAQEAWVALAQHPRSRPWAVMGRLDSTAIFDHASWPSSFQLLEPNAVGVGGVHYAPTACSIIADVLGEVLARAFPGRAVVPTPDPRQLLLDEVAGFAKRTGRMVRRIGLLENIDFTTGTDEFTHLARYFTARGLTALVVDPRELRLARGRLVARGVELDVLYRDCELNEFIDMEASGGRRLKALRSAITEGRLLSGLLWEFDHKSCWELFTDPTFAKYFSTGQRALFHRHLPWTRLVREGLVSDPAGKRTELTAYIRRHQSDLVLKPNVLYGGQGVAVGHAVTRRAWERTLAQGLRGRTPYVVQRLARIAQHAFPRLHGGHVESVMRGVVSGFFFNSSRTGLVGRFSEDPVVNVSRGGGLVGAFVVE